MTNEKKESTTQLGFLAVSRAAMPRMAVFPIMPGFGAKPAKADLRTQLAKGDWDGYAISIDPKGKLRIRSERAKD